MIKFTVVDDGNENVVEYNSSMTCKEFMLDYLRKFTNNVTLDINVYNFHIRSKILNIPRFLEKKLSDVISSGAKVTLTRKKSCCYSGGLALLVLIWPIYPIEKD